MIRRALGATTVCFVGVAVATIFTLTLTAQDKPASDPAQGPASKLAGQWHFNKDLSTPPPDAGDQPQGPPAGRGGRSGGGGGYRGGGGGRGGFGGGGAGGGETMSDDMLKMRELMRQMNDPASVLNIVIHGEDVTITDDRGAVQKFTTDGRKQEVELGTERFNVKTRWDADVLTQEFAAGKMTVTETYQVTVQGHMLVVTIEPMAGDNNAGRAGRGARAPIKYIYERAE